ncbi:uncharacterized protein EV422DRAFT_562750 [Fimicolochytrium jonesii]|uniref:uncharacterized protein n=1 Tax=Fimicolochytrium jonesii TaxID=1396493 RepID=UPI0022FE0A83|nr:uncharacterized protein EV422DRAFT_562750 [Fimicolochytrium jonesii]KAI8826697.1 hypothetical protein EV422DRAFT_562750 [Fimicolochytrium jonesii]
MEQRTEASSSNRYSLRVWSSVSRTLSSFKTTAAAWAPTVGVHAQPNRGEVAIAKVDSEDSGGSSPTISSRSRRKTNSFTVERKRSMENPIWPVKETTRRPRSTWWSGVWTLPASLLGASPAVTPSSTVSRRDETASCPSTNRTSVDFASLKYTRESFVDMLFDTHLYEKFVAFAKATLCTENVMFYEAFVHLEVLLAKYVPVEIQMEAGMTRCLTRFLLEQSSRSSSPASTKGNSVPRSSLPIEVQQAITQFYRTFIMAGSPFEVNISHAIRQNVVDSLPEMFATQNMSEKGISLSENNVDCDIPVTIFDEAADEILDLLFRNTFHLFVTQQYEPSGLGL